MKILDKTNYFEFKRLCFEMPMFKMANIFSINDNRF